MFEQPRVHTALVENVSEGKGIEPEEEAREPDLHGNWRQMSPWRYGSMHTGQSELSSLSPAFTEPGPLDLKANLPANLAGSGSWPMPFWPH